MRPKELNGLGELKRVVGDVAGWQEGRACRI
jgi:hypothetical protein